jgi:hypothetical protein
MPPSWCTVPDAGVGLGALEGAALEGDLAWADIVYLVRFAAQGSRV